MKAILVIQRKNPDHPDGWELFTSIEIEVPFAHRKINTVIEAVATLASALDKLQATGGIFRIGHDDAAIIEWNGVSPHILTPVSANKDPITIIVSEAQEALKQKN